MNDYSTFELIMNLQIKWPDTIDPLVKDLITQLLKIEPMERLGAGLPGSGKTMEDLKNHKFFKHVNWSSISSSSTLPFNKEDAIEKLNAFKKSNQEDIFGEKAASPPKKSSSQFSKASE